MGEALALPAAALALAVAIAEIVATDDAVMAFHAWILALSTVAAGAWLLMRRVNGRAGEHEKGYNHAIVRAGVIASMFWGIAGFLVGDVLAWQLAYPVLNFDLPWTNFGRLRPLHTSAVIFAFGGNVLLATSFFVVQRTSHTRLAGHMAPWFVFWGYQLFIVFAATG